MLPCVWAAAACYDETRYLDRNKVSIYQGLRLKRWQIQPVKTFRPKGLKGTCLSPFLTIEVGYTGEVGLCGCSNWLPTKVGNLFDDSIQNILASARSQAIRASIVDGSYIYCDELACGPISNGLLDSPGLISPDLQPLLDDPSKFIMPREIFMAGDRTCNLSCPSCRTGVLKNSAETVNDNIKIGEILRKNLFSIPTTDPIRLHVSISGEIFASPMLMSFVQNIRSRDFPNLQLELQTNGLLAERNWHRLGDMKTHVQVVTVTTDAARPGTYEKLRRGGTWDECQQALHWLSKKCRNDNIKLHLRMVVQRDNFFEMLEFYEQAQNFGADRIEYARLTNWNTYSPREFQKHDVFAQDHPEYTTAMDMLNQVKSLPKTFFFGGL